MKQRTVDLLHGNILTVLTRLAVPIMATALVQTAYNLTDMAWIGVVGSDAVAAVGAAGMYTWLSTGVVMMAKMGGQVMVAQSIGQGKRERAVAFGRGAMQMTLLLSILYGLVTVVFAKPLIGFFHLNSAQVAREAAVYLRIACGLIIFPFFGQTITGLYTAAGNSRTPFIANCLGLVINLVFDPVLILGVGPFPALGVAGAAIATVSAQAVVVLALVAAAVVGKEPFVSDQLTMWRKIPAAYFGRIIRIGIPAAIQELVYCGISMVLTRFVTAWGDGAVAVQRVGGQIESLSWMTAQGFGTAINAFTGQNYGAGNFERVKKGYHQAALIMLAWGTFTTALLIFGAVPIFSVFIHEAEVIGQGASYLRIIGVCEMFMCIELMTVGAMSGLGKTMEASAITVVLTAMRIPLAMVLGHTGLGLDGVWWALSISSISKGIVFFIYYMRLLNRYTRRRPGDFS